MELHLFLEKFYFSLIGGMHVGFWIAIDSVWSTGGGGEGE